MKYTDNPRKILGRVDVIYSEAFDTPRLGDAIMNRLLKAAGHEVIKV